MKWYYFIPVGLLAFFLGWFIADLMFRILGA